MPAPTPPSSNVDEFAFRLPSSFSQSRPHPSRYPTKIFSTRGAESTAMVVAPSWRYRPARRPARRSGEGRNAFLLASSPTVFQCFGGNSLLFASVVTFRGPTVLEMPLSWWRPTRSLNLKNNLLGTSDRSSHSRCFGIFPARRASTKLSRGGADTFQRRTLGTTSSRRPCYDRTQKGIGRNSRQTSRPSNPCTTPDPFCPRCSSL